VRHSKSKQDLPGGRIAGTTERKRYNKRRKEKSQRSALGYWGKQKKKEGDQRRGSQEPNLTSNKHFSKA